MKFKLLVNGNNLSLVKDFFSYTGQYFDCISTTDVIKDMTAHFQLFNPTRFCASWTRLMTARLSRFCV